MRLAVLAGFVRIERGVDAAEDDERARCARQPANRVATQRVGGVDADADHVARPTVVEIERLEGLVDDAGSP